MNDADWSGLTHVRWRSTSVLAALDAFAARAGRGRRAVDEP